MRGAGTSGAPTASRAFAFDALQSELVKAVRVFKSPRADLAEGGLSGTVDVRTRRPFDDGGGLVLAGSATAAHGTLAERTGGRVSGIAGNTFGDAFGVLVGAAYDDRRVREDWIGHPDYEPKLFDRAVGLDGAPLAPCGLLPDVGGAACGYAPANVRLGLVAFANPNSGATYDVPGLSRHTLNAAVFYERGRLAARVAWNRRGGLLASISDTRSNPRFARAHAPLDANVAWRLAHGVTLLAEGINLTHENVVHYNVVGPHLGLKQLRPVANTGPRVQVGVRVSLAGGAGRDAR